jgi:lysine 2,3-aminomutase
MATLRTPAQLCEHGLVPPDLQPVLETVAARYAVAVPKALAKMIDRSDPQDPIARNLFPMRRSSIIEPARLAIRSAMMRIAPLGNRSSLSGPRAAQATHTLLRSIAVFVSAGNDRPGQGKCAVAETLKSALDYPNTPGNLGSDPYRWRSVSAVGAASAVSDEDTCSIDHVRVVRIHTRMPVADPARITPDLVRTMKIKGKPTYVAVHVNHPRELTVHARAACARMADAGMPLLSQTVLLAGVNDTPGSHGRADAGLWSNAIRSHTICIIAIWRPVLPICAPARPLDSS